MAGEPVNRSPGAPTPHRSPRPDTRHLESLVEDLLKRTPEPGELVGPTRFLLGVLDLTDSPNIHQVILEGQAAS